MTLRSSHHLGKKIKESSFRNVSKNIKKIGEYRM